MKTTNRMLAVLLALVLLCVGVPFAAQAEDETEPAEPTEWIEVSTIEDLYCIRYDLAANYKLMNDLDLTEATAVNGDWSFENQGWDPIGSDGRYFNKAFSGIFDGCGHTIYGLTMNVTKIPTAAGSYVYFGLFSNVSGTVRNLTVTGRVTARFYLTGQYVGGIAGYLTETGRIENCANQVKLNASGNSYSSDEKYYVGGIAGYGQGTVENCYNAADITVKDESSPAQYFYAAGIVGYASGSVNKCLNSGKINVTGYYNSSNSSNSYCGYLYASGIANYGSAENCYNTGSVSSQSGLYNRSSGIGYGTSCINCYNTGMVSGSSAYAISSKTATNCYFLNGTGNNVEGATAVSAAQLKRQAIFNGWDFDTVWTMEGREDYDYPELRNTPLILPEDLQIPIGGTLKISGICEVGEKLTADLSAVTPSGATVNYAWKIGNTLVGSAKTYTLKEEDVNNELTLTVTGTGDYKGSLTATCVVGEVHEHEEEVISYVAPTCAAVGYTEGVRCAVCGEILVEQKEIAKLPHTPKTVAGYASTCIRTGLSDGSVCEVCGAVLIKQKRIATIDHDFVFVEGTLPTCTEPGLTDGSQCSMCGAWETAQDEIPALGHAYSAQETVDPTCSEQGYTVYVCLNGCGSTYTDDYVEATGDHEWKEVVTQTGSCTVDEIRVYTCNNCGESYTETTPAPGHIDEDGDGVCDACQKTISGGNECQHSWIDKDIVEGCLRTAADCQNAATYYYRCHNCQLCANEVPGAENQYFGWGDRDPNNHPKDQLEIYQQEVPATCTQNGTSAGIKCKACGKVVQKVEITTKDHTGGTATCSKKAVCTVCGQEYGNYDTTKHNLEYVALVTATCTKKGMKEHWKCKDCGKLFSDTTGTTETTAAALETPATGKHTPKTAATCIEKAVCTVCGQNYGGVDPANHYNLKKVNARYATCKDEGNIEYWYCDGCGKYYKDADAKNEITKAETVIEKTAHTWDTWRYPSDFDCAKGGEATRTCMVCGEKEVLTIAPNAHLYTVASSKPATCSETGETTYTCSVCGSTYTESIPTTDHDEGSDGYCVKCGQDLHPSERCAYCGQIHNGGFFDSIVGFFHKIFAIFKR